MLKSKKSIIVRSWYLLPVFSGAKHHNVLISVFVFGGQATISWSTQWRRTVARFYERSRLNHERVPNGSKMFFCKVNLMSEVTVLEIRVFGLFYPD